VPGLPTGLDAVVATALAKDPDARYATVTELSSAAKACLVVPSLPRAAEPDPVEPTRTTEVPTSTAATRPVPPPPTETARAPGDADRHQPAPVARRWGPLIAVGAVLVAAVTVAAVVLLSPRTEAPIVSGGGAATPQSIPQSTPTIPPRNNYVLITTVDGTQTQVLPSSFRLCGSPMSDASDVGFYLVRLEVFFVGPKAVAVRFVQVGRESTTEDVERPCEVYGEDAGTFYTFDIAKVRSIAFRY
jgi:hypothetical protein